MIYLIWLVTLIISFYAGYKLRDLTRKIEQVQEVLQAKVDKKPEPVEPQSTLIDVDDPIQTARFEHEKMMRELNE